MNKLIEDEFRGDTVHMRGSIKALIQMSDDGTLSTPLGGHARALLAASYHRLKDSERLEWLLEHAEVRASRPKGDHLEECGFATREEIDAARREDA